MSIILNGTTGITAPAIDATLDAADLTGDVAASQITTALNATGDAPLYACRAWVSFNGQGTVAIIGSGNVSSITDNGEGDYKINFTTAMVDADFVAVGMNRGNAFVSDDGETPVASSFTLRSVTYQGNKFDSPNIYAAFFR